MWLFMDQKIIKSMKVALKSWKAQDDKWVKSVNAPKFTQNVKKLPNGYAFTVSTRSISAQNNKTERYHLLYNKTKNVVYTKTAKGSVRKEWTLNKFITLFK